MTPRVVTDHYAIRVYFGDVLHLHVDRAKYVGLQSWTDHAASYSIEITTRDGASITLEYDRADKWRAVLKAIDEVL
jgi:hypothetical protein